MSNVTFANKAISAELAATLTDKIVDVLYDNYTTSNGTEIQAQAISFVKANAVTPTVKGIGNDLEELLEALGFEIVEATNRKGGKAKVVTL